MWCLMRELWKGTAELNSWQLLNLRFVELLQLLLLTFKQGLKSPGFADSVAFLLKQLIRFCAGFYVVIF